MTTQNDRANFEKILKSLPFYAKKEVNLKFGNPAYPYDYDDANLLFELYQALAHERQLKPVQADDAIRRSDAILRLSSYFGLEGFTPKNAIEAINTIPAISNREALYIELIMAVGNKYPNETRHETALRYIKSAEIPNSNGCSALITDKKEG
jgi:hypothetical protein